MTFLEIACFNEESALIAAEAGADRVELCRDKQTNGLTPFTETIISLRSKITIAINVMIRPREGDFVYSKEEFEQMQEAILRIKKLNINGFVFGILNPNGSINMDQNKTLLNLAYPLPCTFHKAFDASQDIENSLEILIDLGFNTVLTSGGANTALEGALMLKKLNKQAENKITVLAGGSVRSENIKALIASTGLDFYHSSAITDGGEIANPDEIKKLKQIMDQENLLKYI